MLNFDHKEASFCVLYWKVLIIHISHEIWSQKIFNACLHLQEFFALSEIIQGRTGFSLMPQAGGTQEGTRFSVVLVMTLASLSSGSEKSSPKLGTKVSSKVSSEAPPFHSEGEILTIPPHFPISPLKLQYGTILAKAGESLYGPIRFTHI